MIFLNEQLFNNDISDTLSFYVESEYNYNNILEQIGIYELNYMEENGQEIVYTEAETKEVKNKFKEFFDEILRELKELKEQVLKFFTDIIDKIKSFHPVLDKLSRCEFKNQDITTDHLIYRSISPVEFKSKFQKAVSGIPYDSYDDAIEYIGTITFEEPRKSSSTDKLSNSSVNKYINILRTMDISKIKKELNDQIKDVEHLINTVMAEQKTIDDKQLAILNRIKKTIIDSAAKNATEIIKDKKRQIDNAKHFINVALKNIDKEATAKMNKKTLYSNRHIYNNSPIVWNEGCNII